MNTARDSSQEESIKAQLAERMRNSKVFVLLVGEHTRYLTKFVIWEIDRYISKFAHYCCQPQWKAFNG